jgi:hypothetical protein
MRSLTFIFFIGFLGCINPTKKTPPIVEEITDLGTPLVSVGYNESPRFSQNFRKIIYSSKNRPLHSSSQIYSYDLDQKKEIRLTHQDGAAVSPELTQEQPNEEFIYLSDTDLMKEKPLRFYPELWASGSPGNSIFRSSTAKDFIAKAASPFDLHHELRRRSRRITHEATLVGQKGNTFSIGHLDLLTDRVVTVGLPQKRKIKSALFWRPGIYIWVEEDPTDKLNQIWLGRPGNSPGQIDFSAQEIESLTWWDHQSRWLLINGKKTLDSPSQVWIFDLKNLCHQELFFLPGFHILAWDSNPEENLVLLTYTPISEAKKSAQQNTITVQKVFPEKWICDPKASSNPEPRKL